MRFVIVTGISGAGKNTVLKMLEDADYFCVDNLPIQLIPKMAQIAVMESRNISKVALGVDIRSREGLEKLPEILEQVDNMQFDFGVCNRSID